MKHMVSRLFCLATVAGLAFGASAAEGFAERVVLHRGYLTGGWTEIGALKPGESFSSFYYGTMNGAAVSPKYKNEVVFPYNTTVNDETRIVSAQFQLAEGSCIKCVVVDLKTEGAKLYAKAVRAKYVNSGSLGFDFDAGGSPSSVATGDSSSGYGINALAVKVVSTKPQQPEPPRKKVKLAYEGSLDRGWTKVAEVDGTGIKFVSFDGGLTCGNAMTADKEFTPCNQKGRSPVTTTVQFQCTEGGVKCVNVAAQVVGNSVWMKITSSKYLSSASIGYDFDDGGSDQGTNYGVKNVKFTVSREAKYGTCVFIR